MLFCACVGLATQILLVAKARSGISNGLPTLEERGGRESGDDRERRGGKEGRR